MHGRSGGAAAAGGITFQALGTAVCFSAILTGRIPAWVNAQKINAVLAETGGPGDDIVLETDEGHIEIQAKKGLTGGKKLWDALKPLVNGLGVNPNLRAVLLVDPTTSGTIRHDLTRDLGRIADGRHDDLTKTGQATLNKLKEWGLPSNDIARRLVIATLEPAHAHDLLMRDLAPLWPTDAQTGRALTWLKVDATRLIETRGRRDLSRLVNLLHDEGLTLSHAARAPASRLAQIASWVERTTANFSILGVPRPIHIDSGWVRLKARRSGVPTATDLPEALQRYHTGPKVDRDSDHYDVEWLGRFVPQCVLIGGPGSGKSLAAQMIARRYAQDGHPVLRVSLSQVAAAVQMGSSVEEACWRLGLDGSGLTPAEGRSLPSWVLLADGLDECGPALSAVAAGLARLGAGHPDWRIILTTRPIGYDTTELAAWRHYSLVDLDETAVKNGISQLVGAIIGPKDEMLDWTLKAAPKSFQAALSRTPLLVALTASLVAAGRKIDGSRTEIYGSMVAFMEEATSARHPVSAPDTAVRARVLDLLGTAIIETPLATAEHANQLITNAVSSELDITRLAAARVVEGIVDHWCRVGLVERIRHLNHEAYTFAHRTFAEFVAARQLLEAYRSDPNALKLRLRDPAWAEVIHFSARLGLAEQILADWCRPTPLPAISANRLAEALSILSAPEPELLIETVRGVFCDAVTLVGSDRQDLLITLADGLVQAAARHPEIALPHADELAKKSSILCQIVGLHMALVAQRNGEALDRVQAMLPTLLPIVEDGSFWGNKNSLHSENPTGLVGRFLESTLTHALETLDDDQKLTWLAEIKPFRDHLNVGFAIAFEKALADHGLTDWLHANPLDAFGKSADLSSGFKRMEVAWKASLRRVILPYSGKITSSADVSLPLLHFSALVAATGWWQCSPRDTVPISDDPTLEREIISALLPLLPIDRSALTLEASALPAADDDSNVTLGSYLAHVDVSETNWSNAKPMDMGMLESAIRQTSPWIARIATELLHHSAEPQDQTERTRSLLADARGVALWEATKLAISRPPAEASDLIYEALGTAGPERREPLLHGALSLGVWEDRWHSHCKAALESSSVEDAVAAAKLLAKLAPDDEQTLALVTRAALDWKNREAPYPTKGGVVPQSPRASLLAYRARRHLTLGDLIIAANDPRSDVQDVAFAALRTIANTECPDSVNLAKIIQEERLSPDKFAKLLDKDFTPTTTFTEALFPLLNHENFEWRLLALRLVEKAPLTISQKRRSVTALLNDPRAEIRRRAELAHSRLEIASPLSQ